MITEDYVNSDIAKLLQEKRFPVKEVKTWYCEFDGYPDKNIVTNKQYPQITHQMVMKWLREVHKLFITIDWTGYENEYTWSIQSMNNGMYKESDESYILYEHACESVILFCLENLIN